MKYLLVFKGFSPSEEEREEYEQTWNQWIEEIRSIGTLQDAGLLGKGMLMTPSDNGKVGPLSPAPDNATGYMVVEADNEDAVVTISKKCPTCEISGVIEIYPIR